MEQRSGKPRVIVKIGTDLVAKNGGLDHDYIGKVAKAVAGLSKTHEVVLWSSGAVAAGREKLGVGKKDGSLAAKRMLASVGQPELVNAYSKALGKYGLAPAQFLITGRGVKSREPKRLMRETVDVAFKTGGIVPIGNVNDPLTNEEFRRLELGAAYYAAKNALKTPGGIAQKAKTFSSTIRVFPDNDRAVSKVAKQIGASQVIILSNVEGLHDRPPEEGGKLISYVPHSRFGVKGYRLELGGAKAGGSGGMLEKYLAAKRLAAKGISVTIANGRDPAIISGIMRGDKHGTFFAPKPAKPRTARRR
ncbi:MAG: hypothetical protein WC792_00260 [Candidatus Micrarchaeia archaeon]|jgi:glutamate 5-kinase